MSHELAATQLQLGHVERLILLDGHLPRSGGPSMPAAAVQTERGVWLVGADSGAAPECRPLHGNPSLRYEARVFGDRLHLDGLRFGVPLGKAAELKLAIGVGCLNAESRGFEGPLPEGHFLQPSSVLWTAWLRSALAPDEEPLAWLETSEFRDLPSEATEELAAPVRFLLTDQRVLLVALNELGQARRLELDALPMSVEEGGGRRMVRIGTQSWTTTRANGADYRALAAATELTGAGRIREIARLEHATHPHRSLRLVRDLGDRAHAEDHVLACLLEARVEARELDNTRVLRALAELRAAHPDSSPLERLLQDWSIGHEAAIRVVALGVDDAPDEAAWFLGMHRGAHTKLLDTRPPATVTADADIALAEHLLLAGLRDEAARLLGERLRHLPDEQLSDLLPPSDADLTAGEAGQAHRIRALELLAMARGTEESPDLEATAELARLQPLVASRVRDLAGIAEGELAQRAREALSLHEDLRPQDEDAGRIPHPATLSRLDLQDRLQHPAARSEGVLGWMQGWLAKQEQPDRSTLKAYCEHLRPRRHEATLATLSEAAVALGMEGVEAYVSHGVLHHGLRAYEDQPSYLLIGGSHLYEDELEYLRPAELRFAVGSELAHLAFQHNRVTSSEVWAGAFDKLRSALDLAATALSFGAPIGKVLESNTTYKVLNSVFSPNTLRRLYRAEKAGQAISTVGSSVTLAMSQGAEWVGSAQSVQSGVGTAVDKVRQLTSGGAQGRSLAVDQRELVVAHRVMQLTADRAGLLLSGDVRASVRAIFLTGADSLKELPVAENHGIDRALSRRGPEGEMLHQDLAIRVGALLSFYLSQDYARLRSKLEGYSPATDPSSEGDSGS
jgi:hypothetical protein